MDTLHIKGLHIIAQDSSFPEVSFSNDGFDVEFEKEHSRYYGEQVFTVYAGGLSGTFTMTERQEHGMMTEDDAWDAAKEDWLSSLHAWMLED